MPSFVFKPAWKTAEKMPAMIPGTKKLPIIPLVSLTPFLLKLYLNLEMSKALMILVTRPSAIAKPGLK